MGTPVRRCLLFMPPAFTPKKAIDINPAPPLGLGYIAAVLEGMGKEVRIVDCLLEGWHHRVEVDAETLRIGLPAEEIRRIIEDYRPDLVAVNSQFTRQYKNAHEIYGIAKSVDRRIVTVAGGAHPSVLPVFALEDANLDYVVIGEGEEIMQRLVAALSGESAAVEAIDGIGFRKDGKPVVNKKVRFIEDLDSIPLPAWHLMHVERYFGLPLSHGKRQHKRFFSIITSRGCPARCVFCTAFNVWGRKYRARSPEKVVEEMQLLQERYGIEELLIEDDNFTFDVERADRICNLIIEKRLRIGFDTPNGIAAYRLTPALLSKMKEAGFFKINLAIESGNQQALTNIIKKPLKLDRLEALVRHCREIGLDVGVFFIVGIPGITIREMWDNYSFSRSIKVYDPFISIATPYPGSELYEICKDKGYLSRDFDLERLYIRTFSIKTDEWGPLRLRLLLGAGYLYLKFFQALDDPVGFARLLAAHLRSRFSPASE